MTETEVPTSLAAFGYPSQRATAVIVEQSPGQRFARALAGLGLFWGLALGGLFIPVAHFVLVPTFGPQASSWRPSALASIAGCSWFAERARGVAPSRSSSPAGAS